MTSICFVCNLPILSHQVGLVWDGGNGMDLIQSDQSTPRNKGRRDSSAQIATYEPTPLYVRETSPPVSRRRRSSLAQLTDIFRDWGRKDDHRPVKSYSTTTRKESKDLKRRDSLVEFAKMMPWSRRDTSKSRRDSSVDGRKRRQSGNDLKGDISKFLAKRESVSDIIRRRKSLVEKSRKEKKDCTTQICITDRSSIFSADKSSDVILYPNIIAEKSSQQNNGNSYKTDNFNQGELVEPKICVTSQISIQESDFRKADIHSPTSPVNMRARRDKYARSKVRTSRSPARSPARSPVRSPERRDGSRDPSPNKFHGLRRQSTPIEEGLCLPRSRKESRPFLSPDRVDINPLFKSQIRRDSLSPDSAAFREFSSRKLRRDSKTGATQDQNYSSKEPSPKSFQKLRRQSTTAAADYLGRRPSRGRHSPDTSSTCSSREPSPKGRRVRRQSTTEEILMSRGFRRQSTTEDIMRARNFRRQSSQHTEISKSRGRRDSCAQITDGTIATMTVETSSAFFDISTQTGI